MTNKWTTNRRRHQRKWRERTPSRRNWKPSPNRPQSQLSLIDDLRERHRITCARALYRVFLFSPIFMIRHLVRVCVCVCVRRCCFFTAHRCRWRATGLVFFSSSFWILFFVCRLRFTTTTSSSDHQGRRRLRKGNVGTCYRFSCFFFAFGLAFFFIFSTGRFRNFSFQWKVDVESFFYLVLPSFFFIDRQVT